MSQYLLDRWGVESGYPGGAVHAITQTPDGYLWIAAEKGLVRFDGVTFTLLAPPVPADSGPGVLGLAVDQSGGVWARLGGPILMRYDGTRFERIDRPGDPYTVVTALHRGADSLMLTPLGHGVLRHRDGRVSTAVSSALMPNSFVTAMAETPDGSLWLGTRDAGLLRARGSGVVSITRGLPDRKVNALQAAGDGTVWVATDGGAARWDGTTMAVPDLPAAVRGAAALALARDRHANIWVALGGRGLVRLSGNGAVATVPWDSEQRGGLTALFEDREGSLWLGTTRGVERLRDGHFRTYTTREGLPADNVGPIHADDVERLWMGPPQGGLYWMAGGMVHRVGGGGLDDDVVYSVTGQAGDVWVGRQRGGLTRVRLTDGRPSVLTLTVADGLAQNSVFAVHQSRDGTVWAGTLSAGVSQYRHGTFTTYTVADGLASNTVAAILEASNGSMWFGTPTGVSVRAATGWRTLTTADGLPGNDVSALFEDAAATIWIGTSNGLAYVRDGRVGRVPASSPLSAPILGIGGDRGNALWVSTPERLWLADGGRLGPGDAGPGLIRAFDRRDGLASVEGVKRHRTVVADARGRVWISLAQGLSQSLAAGPSGPPPSSTAQVETILADAHTLARGALVDVPARTRRVTLTLAVPGATVPERVRFRYRLDGFDAEWSAPTTSRQVAYTNLPPGTFAFRVMAFDDSGAWEGRESRLALRVAPAYWQTTWFLAAVGLLVGLAGWGGYRVRLRHVARRMDRVYEERLAERTRIAQELHDTLLQGCLSASMQLHVVVDTVPVESTFRPTLERVVHLLRAVIDDGRAAVRGLRVSDAVGTDLEQALANAPAQLAIDHDAAFRVVVEGRPRPLHPGIRDDAYRIGREAIANALRHARAAHVEVELEYTPSQFRLAVRDDGIGIPDDVRHRGRDGHWGLHGMRERAQAIRATLRILSLASAGTEVELVVPADLAYGTLLRRRAPWWTRLTRPAIRTHPRSGEDSRP
ncbi:sensor histidine kinase [Luteitalea sp.]